jgi:DNA-binding transcriptional LysR family regulator
MNWNDIRYFLAASRHSGLSGAAKELKASPSTVARRIEMLEEALRTQDIWLVVHDDIRRSRRIRVVCDFLEAVVKQQQTVLAGAR